MEFELHGRLTELAGRKHVSLSLQTPVRVDEALARLAEAEPVLAPHLPRVACAVGDELVPRAARVDGNAPLVLLPPVSGG